MSAHRDKVLDLISSDTPLTLTNWGHLLTFFERYHSELDTDEIEMLAGQSEVFRSHWNTDREIKQTFIKNGEEVTLVTTKRGLGIERSKVTPNIQAYLEANRI